MLISNVDSPSHLAGLVKALFPAFADELRGEAIDSYQQVFMLLSPRIAGYLQSSSERTARVFSALLNSMVSSGGDQENAVSTCLLGRACLSMRRKSGFRSYFAHISVKRLGFSSARHAV
jgi:hypothetical protein